MHWKIKASIQKVLSLTRIGDKINHLNVIAKKDYHKSVFNYQFYECLRKLKLTKLDLNNKNLTALEIGTGYSVVAPIILFLLGFNKIVTVDISNDIVFKSFKKQISYLKVKEQLDLLIENSIYDKKEIVNKLNEINSLPTLHKIFEFCHIIYLPKYSLNDIDALDISFDYIYSQVVFEHIPPNFLESLFKKFKQWLKPNGYSVHTINFIDHFANPGFFQDKNISEFNFLRYSDKFWNFWAGNPIAYTNRLSYLFYIDLCKNNNFKSINFFGKNYRPKAPLLTKLIHKDVLNKYNNIGDFSELTKFQRGTLVIK